MIDQNHAKLSVSVQCNLLSLSAASYYRLQKEKEVDKDLTIMHQIDEIYLKYPFYGSRKIQAHLQRAGHTINRKRVQRIMRKLGITAVAPGPNTSTRNKAHSVYPYLIRNLKIQRPNQVWCADITYIRLRCGFAYLIAVMDWYSRKVLSWELSNSMDTAFCISALRSALRQYDTPDIFNTDQGVQFTSHDFTDVLKENQVQISMDGKGRWMDNVFIERLWRSLKYEDIYIHNYETMKALKEGVKRYMHFYNTVRTHQSHGGKTPEEVYTEQAK